MLTLKALQLVVAGRSLSITRRKREPVCFVGYADEINRHGFEMNLERKGSLYEDSVMENSLEEAQFGIGVILRRNDF